jgi:AAA family ATP:ADP antiporter
MALAGSVGFLFTPVLLTGSALYIFDNGFNNSINQSSKEVLYVPTTRVEKYQAKAFIDMFVQRLAKAVAVGLSLAITTLFVGFGSVRWLSLVTALILVAWISIVRFAGKEFEKISGKPPSRVE